MKGGGKNGSEKNKKKSYQKKESYKKKSRQERQEKIGDSVMKSERATNYFFL